MAYLYVIRKSVRHKATSSKVILSITQNLLFFIYYTAICGKCQYRILQFDIIFQKTEVIMQYRRIRDLREDSDVTQKEMARILNCSQQVYSNYELGQRDIPTDILIKLSAYYKVSVDYILGISDNPKIKLLEDDSRDERI